MPRVQVKRKLRPQLTSLQIEQSPATVRELFTRWEQSMLTLYKPSTQQFMTTTMNQLLRQFGGMSINEVSTEGLQAYISKLRCSPKTIANRITVFRAIWKTAMKWGYVYADPFGGLTLPRLVVPESRCFTLEEVLAIIGAAKEPYKTLFKFAAETGLRGGEICALPWREVNVQERSIRVVQSIWRGQISTPKTRAGRRTICISAHLADALQALNSPRTGTVFADASGRPLNPEKVVQRQLRPILLRLGVEGGGLHAFRHFNASLMDSESVPMKTRQARLGHNSPQTTLQLYTHLLTDADRKTATALGSCLSSAQSQRLLAPTKAVVYWYSSSTTTFSSMGPLHIKNPSSDEPQR